MLRQLLSKASTTGRLASCCSASAASCSSRRFTCPTTNLITLATRAAALADSRNALAALHSSERKIDYIDDYISDKQRWYSTSALSSSSSSFLRQSQSSQPSLSSSSSSIASSTTKTTTELTKRATSTKTTKTTTSTSTTTISPTTTTTTQWPFSSSPHRSLSSVPSFQSSSLDEPSYLLAPDQFVSDIPPEINQVVVEYASKPQTSASLQMLMRSGSGQGSFSHTSDATTDNYQEFSSQQFKGRRGKHLAIQRILIQVASFLRQELPIRLARRIHDLDRMPLMREMPSVKTVKQIYIDSLLEFLEFPEHIHSSEEEQEFAELLERLYTKHSDVLVKMAKGAYELREAIRKGRVDKTGVMSMTQTTARAFDDNTQDQEALDFARMRDCHKFLDRFYMSRIGIRVLAGQYLALRQQQLQRMEDLESMSSSSSSSHDDEEEEDPYIGMICYKTSPFLVVRQAAEDAKRMCRNFYGRAPQVEIHGRTDLTFPYIPTYLHYILLELLKNALRATCERHDRVLPPVVVIIADGHDNEDVVIKIADEGGGIPRSQVDKIWSYLFTTADPKVQKAFIGSSIPTSASPDTQKQQHSRSNNNSNGDHSSSNQSPIAGLGYGLPISRSYCEYFGGALDLVSMEGYGTDAFIHLKRLGDSEEPLPV